MKFLSLACLFLCLTASAADHGAAPASKTGGWEALSALQTGNMRFFEGRASHPNQSTAVREQLSTGQHPEAIVVSCSDSRVPPETVFDQGLGNIFSVRLAGNLMTTEAIASIEYAVEHLGPKLLIVMGHESCGAVGAAVGSVPGKSNGSPSLDSLVHQIRSGLSAAAVSEAAGDKTFRHGVKENVTASLADLIQKSEIVRNAAASKGLVLGQAIYNLKSGRVEFWDVGKPIAAQDASDKVILTEPTVKEEVISDVMSKPKAKTAAPKAKAHH